MRNRLLSPLSTAFLLGAMLMSAAVMGQTASTNPQMALAHNADEVSRLTSVQAEAQLAEVRERLGRAGDGRSMTTEVVTTTVNDLAKERDRIQIVIEGKKAREAAMQKRIRDLTAEAQERTEKDKVLQQLEAAADAKKKLAEQAHERVAVAAGGREVELAAISEAAEAVARVHERRDAIASAVGGGVLPQLNRELIEVSLDLTEQQAVLAGLDERLTQWKDVRQLLRLQMQLNSHMNNLAAEAMGRGRRGGGGRGLQNLPLPAGE